ncbi:protein LRATD2-like [Protopterus annectens]|uniref:protein LRATD2-like n=1 Tax=Protopterus annectens TaxID=7888 RepID=UPI001CFB9AD2|nr:protein LRATD2-like [Protopterus annectens]
MGNQILNALHYQSYEALPMTDPDDTDGNLKSLQSNGLEEEEEERKPEESFHLFTNSVAFYKDLCIYEKAFNEQKLGLHTGETLLNICRPGDLVEFILKDGHSLWVVYTGDFQVVHLSGGIIKKSFLLDISGSYKGRIVNSVYKFPESSADIVVKRAMEQVTSGESTGLWPNSESFAAWCMFGKKEFKKGGELRIGKQPYLLHLHKGDGTAETLNFQTLLDLIEEKIKKEQAEEKGIHFVMQGY